MIKLRDMGIKPRALVAAAAEAGVTISPRRASEIIIGQAYIKPAEMEVIAKMLNRTVDDLYMEIGSAVICPLLSAGGKQFVVCCRQGCAWWNWEMQCCSIKIIHHVQTKGAERDDEYSL
jgi:hypothetical protein